MSSFDIYVFRGVGRTVGQEVFDHHGRAMPLGKPSSSILGVGQAPAKGASGSR